MTKRNKIIYWVSTLWLALGMTSTGIVQFIKMKEEVDLFNRLGYPIYFLTILSIWKILGVVAVLIPRFPLLKEWAYAGFFFAMSGVVLSLLSQWKWRDGLFWASIVNCPDCNIVVFQTGRPKGRFG